MSEKDLSTNGSEVKIDTELSSENNNSLANKSGEVISDIPEVERRLKALKKLQFEKLKLDGEVKQSFLRLLQSKFHDRYEGIYQKRAQIVSGSHRPTDEECDFPEDDSDPYIEESVEDQNSVEGIQDFWLLSLMSFPLIRDWITEEDELVLQHLRNIKVVYNEKPSKLVFEFFFGRNEFFTNEVLLKEYEIGFGPEPQNLFGWNTIPFYPIKRKGCPIDWKESTSFGKMRKTLEKSGKHSDYSPSFFDFFSPPKEGKEFNEDIEKQLVEDWKIALTIYEELVPDAVLHYTGVFNDEDYSESSDPYDSDDEEEDD